MKIRFIICTLLLINSSLYAADRHVREGATGANNGSNWTDAYTSLPVTLTPGDTYYVADGNYPGYTFDDVATVSQRITIKKASVASHGSATGWSNAFGDGQATWGNVVFATAYHTFDGSYRDEAAWRDVTKYGFRLPATGAGDIVIINKGVSHLIFKYLDIGAALGTRPPTALGKCFDFQDYVGAEVTTIPRRDNIYIGYCHGHNVAMFSMVFDIDHLTIDHCAMTQIFGKNVIRCFRAKSGVLKYNVYIDAAMAKSEGAPEDPTTHAIGEWFSQQTDPGDSGMNEWEIYGNVWAGTGAFVQQCSNGIIAASCYGWKIYNNTIAHVDGKWAGYYKFTQMPGAQNILKNNLWYWMGNYDATFGSLMGSEGCSSGYNWTYYKHPGPTKLNYDDDNAGNPRWVGSEDPFVNEAGQDYRIKPAASFTGVSPIGKAFPVGAPYNIDANGVQHNNIGAYATAVGAVSPPTIVTHPANTSVTVGQTANFSVSVTGTTPFAYQWQKNGNNISGAISSAYTTPVTVAGDNGATFRVIVTNSADSATSSNAILTVTSGANVSPTAAITSPAGGASFVAPASITIQANASDSDGTVSVVEFFVDGATNLGGDASSPYSIVWAGVTEGSYSLTARSTDNQGAMTTSSAVAITVTAAPTGQFQIDDRVIVAVDPDLRVRSAASLSGTILGTQLSEAEGTVVAGPTVADGFTWWQIDYDIAPDGWSVEGNTFVPFLLLAPPPPEPVQPGAVTDLIIGQ